ncbi:MAG TPA: penicillin acylase family protein [Longimicrobiales bacterium]
MRKLLLVIGVFVAAVAAVAAAGVAYLRSATVDYDRDAVVAGLGAAVEVWRDSLAVPHLWAATEEDLYFAQGYVHAQDRLWQMEMLRRVAEGRLSELFGERAVESDRFLRTLGLWRAAAAAERQLGPAERRLFEAYAAGVNAWIEGHDGAWPPEFVVLRIRPEPWTVRHTLAIEKIMAWDLSAYGPGLELARAIRRLGAERARFLVPDYPSWGAHILEEAPAPPAVPAIAAAWLERLSVTRASNAWVIAGSKTRSGKPILANDMHLGLDAPAIWYVMALHARDAGGGPLDVVGMTLPGAPGVMAGHNRAIAWGFTNAYVDDVDFFIERVDPADSTRYLTPAGSEPFEVIRDTIRVRGGEPVPLVIRLTRHGPILTSVDDRTGGELIAMRWVAHDRTGSWRALLGFNRAKGWEDFVRAVEAFDNPHQNVVYADTAGHIGYWMGGTVPLRGSADVARAGRDGGPKAPPLAPVPGWTGEWDWVGVLPFERHPHALDPARGYLVTANNRQAAGAVAGLVGSRWADPFRAMRITEMVAGPGPFDAASVHAQQLDVRDAMAARYRDRAVEAAEHAGRAEAAALLRDWDLEARTDSRAAALFYIWRDRLERLAAASLWGDDGEWMPADAVREILERRALPWVDPGGDRAYLALAARALAEADSIAAGRSWGELHQVRIDHPLGAVALLDRLLGLNIGPAPAAGSPTTVNVAYHTDGRGYPAQVTAGPSQRHVVDMADVDGSGGFILPTGQAGIPTSPHYRDQFERWRRGGLWRVPLDRAQADARTVYRMTLLPREGA